MLQREFCQDPVQLSASVIASLKVDILAVCWSEAYRDLLRPFNRLAKSGSPS